VNEILVVDDEKDIREQITGLLEDEGYQTRSAPDGATALKEIEKRQPDLLLLDVWLGDPAYDDLKLLEMIREKNLNIPIIMISGHGTVETAVKAIKLGAFDFIEKPFKTERLFLVIQRALETAQLRRENQALKSQFQSTSELVGSSNAIFQLKKNIEKVAPVNSRVLLIGPFGVGKELIAHQIHVLSLRADGPFLSVNCEGRPDELNERLFGAEGAKAGNLGAFEQAHKGTLYLEDVSSLSADLQSQLVRLLHDGTFTRYNGNQKVKVDVRVLASTRHDLKKLVLEGKFREDLYYRLNIVPLHIPALSERREDIPQLVEHFVKEISRSEGIRSRVFSNQALNLMHSYHWPGNIHELRAVVERVLLLSPAANDQPVTTDELPGELKGESANIQGAEDLLSLPLREARENFERDYLLAQVNKFSGNISRTASFIGMERSALHRKLRHLQLERKEKGFGT
jgi:two-component system nitrogen regulation response regulator NtrX